MASEANEVKFKRGHRRTTSTSAWNKAQPVTDLLLNLPSNNMSTMHLAQTRDTSADMLCLEIAPIYFQLENTKEEDQLQRNISMINNNNKDDDNDDDNDDSKHHYIDRLKDDEIPICLKCTRNYRAADFAAENNAINEMCRILCNKNCQQKLTLEGYQEYAIAKVQRDEVDHAADANKYEDVAKTLAKVSAMTSTIQVKQRLAARKLEMELEQLEEIRRQRHVSVDEQIKSNKSNEKYNNDKDHHDENDVNNDDVINKFMHSENEPTRDLLLYFLR